MPITLEKFNLVWGGGHSFERKVNSESLNFLERWEQFRSRWYPDGHNKDGTIRYSIGFGHAEFGDNWPFKRSDVEEITVAQATEIYLKDVEVKARYINKVLPPEEVRLTTFQFGALVSLVYQQGQGRLTENPIIVNYLKRGEYIVAGTQFLNYSRNAAGEHKDGLLLRRAAEVGLYMTRKD